MFCVDSNDNTVCTPLHWQTARINHRRGKMYSVAMYKPKVTLPISSDQGEPAVRLHSGQKLYRTLFIYFGLSPGQFRKHLTCWLRTFPMWAVNAFQVPAYFNFLSCKVLDQYVSINCTVQPIQQTNGGEKWCSTHARTPLPFKFTNTSPINTSLGAKRFLCTLCNFCKRCARAHRPGGSRP